ncbi:SCO family protein [Pseudoroseomonas globiformis]|uniref:SCO family protein n=1 Tax=Teichococcus globiformis TaxID=2307229 RepID=A0ABV7FTW0_9PROT
MSFLPKRDRLVAYLVLASLLLTGVAWLFDPGRDATAHAYPAEASFSGGRPAGGSFVLVDQDGQPKTDGDFRGGWTLIYFGYASCADVCPTELATMVGALDLLPEEVESDVSPVLISVDPERDTPALLGEYVPQFHPRLTGLTGTPEQLGPVLQAYGVVAEKRYSGGSAEYSMDHSSFFYLLAPDGRLQAVFHPGLSPEALAGGLSRRIAES